MIEIVTLTVEGLQWHRWKRAAVSYSAKDAVRAFAFTLTDSRPFFGQWSFFPGTQCKVLANGELVVDGFINTMSPSFDANNHTVEISGKSKSQDSVASSAVHDGSEFKNKTVLEIAKELDKQGVGFKSDTQLKKHKVFRLNPGESVFDAVERLSRKENLLLIGQADGSILITKGSDKRVHPPLVEGVNILGGSATFSDDDKHSEYKVKGQRAFGTKAGSLRIEATAKDKTVNRNRPKIILPETDITKKDAKDRAKKHRDRQQGESVKASIKVLGWRDAVGRLWEANTLIFVQCPTLKLSMDLLIDSVSLTQDQGGTFAVLSLVHPKALGSDAKTGSKTDKAWSYDPGEDNDNEADEADEDE
jgi:prophage tail gpP-like protein